MTYNFDPDRWYDDELAILDSKRQAGKISRQDYKLAVETLDLKLEKMWARLDGTYQILE